MGVWQRIVARILPRHIEMHRQAAEDFIASRRDLIFVEYEGENCNHRYFAVKRKLFGLQNENVHPRSENATRS
jgi:hypothetical protein